MQIGLGLAFIVALYTVALRRREQLPVIAHLLVGLGSLALLVLGLYVFHLHGMASRSLLLAAYITFCSLIWIVTGIAAYMRMYQWCGWIGLSLVYGWMIQQYAEVSTLGAAQIAWLPVSFLLIWLGWLLQRRIKQIGSVLLITGGFLWFAPEIHTYWFMESPTGMLQLLLLGKISIAGIVLYRFRNQWIEWVV